ncbi:hypothetical protein O3G_MSEX015335 [Manduca sexta]|uniref:Uncharacterized protein n=1 Tax=Manduca sexta TaxID=7130 RepID=A0A922D5A3_MANSE|nr:hypothetical protein O3G_MSEX015335 [Manduca sexta]
MPKDIIPEEPRSTLHACLPYSQPRTTLSPTMPYPTIITETSMSPPLRYPVDPVYIRPLEPIYQIRVPTDEMSYMEYTQMYEHAYRSYYSNINYPVPRPSISEKMYTYEDQPKVADVPMPSIEESPERLNCVEEMPLNLICTKRIECKPIEELIRRTDLPLDLSTKS